MSAPPEIVALAGQRLAARAGRDFAAADRLRAEIQDAGWLVTDTADGYLLSAKPPYDLVPIESLPDRSAEPDRRPATLAVLVEGWPDDVRRCLTAALTHTQAHVLALDAGNVDGAGDALHEFAGDPRVEAWHLAGPAPYAAARNALLRADPAAVHVWLDPSVELTGDAVTPLVEALAEPGVVLAGGWGVDVDPNWLGFHDVAGPAEVDAVLGYLLAVRRSAALAVGGVDPRARFYRNADMEFSFTLRAAGGRAVASAPLPSVRYRHRGYYDTEPAFRDRESKRNYDRFLARYRGRDDLRTRQ